MKRTVDEKLQYNSGQRTAFAYGYRFGVQAYRRYPNADEKQKRDISGDIDYNRRLVQTGDKSRESVQYAKGFMCGVRDAANERKSKQKHR